MNETVTRAGRRRRRRRQTRIGSAIVLLVVFAIGIALGEALHDNPRPDGSRTIVRTLEPLPLAPAARSTVTATAPAP
ncbi:MAG: hypothetical protein ACR2MU_06985 [Gaiellaceae bacterium]